MSTTNSNLLLTVVVGLTNESHVLVSQALDKACAESSSTHLSTTFSHLLVALWFFRHSFSLQGRHTLWRLGISIPDQFLYFCAHKQTHIWRKAHRDLAIFL